MSSELPVIMRTHELYSGVSAITEKLPSLKRQTIGRRLEDATLQLLEFLIMTKNAPKAHKAAYLIKASALTEIIDFHLRTLLEQKLANATTLHQILAKNDEIARMSGGWRRSVQ
jgi:hypothetical protein